MSVTSAGLGPVSGTVGIDGVDDVTVAAVTIEAEATGTGVVAAAGLGLGAFDVAGVALALPLVPVATLPSIGITTPSLFTGSTGFLIISGIE